MSATPQPKKIPKIELTKHPDFRIVLVNSYFGGLTPNEGRIKFYTDILEPKMKSDGNFGEMELEKINRELEVEIRLSVMDFLGLASWMDSHVKRLEEQGILKKEDIARSKKTDYSV